MNARLAIALAALTVTAAQAAPYKVGNGDEGSDLEGTTPVTQGPIIRARDRAAALLERLNTPGVRGLGQLLPELKGSQLYFAKKDVAAALSEDRSPHHANMTGQAYARTFAEPHAPTRFFPAALKLDEEQLTALHIHEALHRALPAEVRTDEEAVTRITLAITSPDSSHDRVAQAVAEVLPEAETAQVPAREPSFSSRVRDFMRSDENVSRAHVSYWGRQFVHVDSSLDRAQSQRGHELALGCALVAREQFQLNLDAGLTALEHPGRFDLAGSTINLDARYFVAGRTYVKPSLSGTFALSDPDGLEAITRGRPTSTYGLAFGSGAGPFYGEVGGFYTSGNTKNVKLGSVEYATTYGRVVSLMGRTGLELRQATWSLRIGGALTSHFSDALQIASPNFGYSTGNYRIITAGPDIAWIQGRLELGVRGALRVSSSQGAEMAYLGNPIAYSSGKGDIGLTATYRF